MAISNTHDNVPSPDVITIHTLNDQLRVDGIGGLVVCTKGILGLETDMIAHIGDAVQNFEDVNEDNDPYGEHDCAVVIVGDQKIIFKIAYFDPTMMFHSDDATNPTTTKRVMTIMLASEY